VSAVDVVIPAWNSRRWLAGCLEALRAQSLQAAQIIVVDDGSSDGTADWIAQHAPDVRLERFERQRGFAAAANLGIGKSTAPFVALLNADTRADAEWLRSLVTALEAAPKDVGSAASKLLQLDAPSKIDNAGDCFTRYGSALKRGRGESAGGFSRIEPVLSASAGAALYRRAMLDDIGPFDETFESYLEDVDLGLRAQLAGYRCFFVPGARVLHQGGGAGLPRRRYVRLVTANRLATVLHSFPTRLLWRHVARLLWGQWYFFVASRHPRQTLLGYWDLMLRLPGVLARRGHVQSRRQLDVEAFDRLLGRELGEPTLRTLLRRRLTTP
jgi:GT2 family glycosyltransferase